MVPFLIVLVIIICVLMVFVVLAQNPKGSGLSGQFGGSGATQLMGAKRTTDLLEKITWGMCVAVFVLCFAANAILDNQQVQQQGYQSPNLQNVNTTGGAPIPVPAETEGAEEQVLEPPVPETEAAQEEADNEE